MENRARLMSLTSCDRTGETQVEHRWNTGETQVEMSAVQKHLPSSSLILSRKQRAQWWVVVGEGMCSDHEHRKGSRVTHPEEQ